MTEDDAEPLMAAKWTPESWRAKSIVQVPTYPDQKVLGEVEERLRNFPPLVFAGEARRLKAYLADVAAGKVKPKKNPKGRLIFTKKMPCSGCHQYVGRKKKITGGRSGPSLVDAGVRLNPDWILAYMQKPKVFKPVKMMPVFVGLLSDKDMMNISRHVASFKPKKKK